MKKTCANPSCGVALIKTDPHDQCFNHRTCGRSHPCMHCSAVSGPEWDSIEKRQAGLAHRKNKEKEVQLSKGGKFLTGTALPQPSAFEEVSSSQVLLLVLLKREHILSNIMLLKRWYNPP